ncbi:MAG: low affinity iron permease family protein [Alphaproteobacteria bacterium]|nr:low affinity iron permease family protein [Alphaproteobacteria bacterium]
MDVTKHFSNFARVVARASGQPMAFILACASVFFWLISGSFFEFSDTWQLVINTSTTIVTFFMVFLIQNTQNRDGEAIQIKLDELIRSHRGAHNALLDLEELTEDQLQQIKDRYEKLAEAARQELRKGLKDTRSTEV